MKNKYLNKNQRHKPIKLKMKIRNRKTHLKAKHLYNEHNYPCELLLEKPTKKRQMILRFYISHTVFVGICYN